jgi:hypothetical protein
LFTAGLASKCLAFGTQPDRHGYSFVNPGAGKAANHPVMTIDWYDCVKWCNARSQLARLSILGRHFDYFSGSALRICQQNQDFHPENSRIWL